jgi:hypothetical protein
MPRFRPLNNKRFTFHFRELSQLKFRLEIDSHLAQDQIHYSLRVLIISDHGICKTFFIDDKIALGLGLWKGDSNSLADFGATE